jgi:SAM-dependent methyltransferase
MMNKRNPLNEIRERWDAIADGWNEQVGNDGDQNRILNSDPLLWEFAGDVSGLAVLDAGCGTGYLSRILQSRGVSVIGIDISPEMIRIAKAQSPTIDYRVDSCHKCATIADASVDMVISNYVLMDMPYLDETMESFHRVLRDNGIVIAIFSHPCFPQGFAERTNERISYHWDFSYFDQKRCIDAPWGRFTTEFIWYHRPLSDYWKAFRSAGYTIEAFDEPHIREVDHHLLGDDAEKLAAYRSRPYSAAFKLRK